GDCSGWMPGVRRFVPAAPADMLGTARACVVADAVLSHGIPPGEFGALELPNPLAVQPRGEVLVEQFRAQLGPARDPERGADRLHVALDGVAGDPQRPGDLIVGRAPGEQLRHLAIPPTGRGMSGGFPSYPPEREFACNWIEGIFGTEHAEPLVVEIPFPCG